MKDRRGSEFVCWTFVEVQLLKCDVSPHSQAERNRLHFAIIQDSTLGYFDPKYNTWINERHELKLSHTQWLVVLDDIKKHLDQGWTIGQIYADDVEIYDYIDDISGKISPRDMTDNQIKALMMYYFCWNQDDKDKEFAQNHLYYRHGDI